MGSSQNVLYIIPSEGPPNPILAGRGGAVEQPMKASTLHEHLVGV